MCLLACCATVAAAQPYDLAERRNPWNAGVNAAGLRADSVTVSYAELYGSYCHGGFRDWSQPESAWSVGAVAETIVSLERYSMKGAFSFDNTSGSGMCGSMFIHPGSYPVNLYEFTPGRKDLQTYAFSGSIAVDVAPGWAVGGSIGFAAANYSKRKDIRHYNYRLDLEVAPSVMYRRDGGAVGLSYRYAKNSELVRADEIGSTVSTYYAFLDKGLMFGAYEAWDGSGIHLNESGISGFPVKEEGHGAGVQVQAGGFYADLLYTRSEGSVGEKGTVWFRFPSHRIESNISWQTVRGTTSHFVRLKTEWSALADYEGVLGRETENGVTITHVYGENLIFRQERLRLNPEYEMVGEAGHFRVGAALERVIGLATHMYPYAVRQSMTCGGAYFSGTLHLWRFDLRGELAFAMGEVSETMSEEAGNGAEAGEPPYRLEEWYAMQNEYLTAPRVMAGIGLRYNFRQGIYIEAYGSYMHGFGLEYMYGRGRWFETLKVGYNF